MRANFMKCTQMLSTRTGSQTNEIKGSRWVWAHYFLQFSLRFVPSGRSKTILSPFLYFICLIDLFSLYILFSHFRPRDAPRGNSFFQMSSYARANLRITNEKTKGKFPSHEGITWSEMGKQNVQAEKVYYMKRTRIGAV